MDTKKLVVRGIRGFLACVVVEQAHVLVDLSNRGSPDRSQL